MKRLLISAVLLGSVIAMIVAVRSSPDVLALSSAVSAYCTQRGGTETISTTGDSSLTGFCRLPNNTLCNSWDLYRGGCPGFPPASSGVLYDANGLLLKEGDVISAAAYGDPDIYIIHFKPHGDFVGYKRLFLNPGIFSFYGHLGGFARVHPVSPATRDVFETSGLFRNCETNDSKIWATEVTGEDTGVLHHIQMTGDQALTEDFRFFDRVFCINTREDNFYAKSIHPYTRLSEVPVYHRPTCTQRPACLDSEPRCLMPEPAEGWCPSPTPTPPPGCYYREVQCVRAPCHPELVCPSPSPIGGPCYIGGCSSQLCTDQPDAVSTCEYRAEYACYQHARCERQHSGMCGWTPTDQFTACWNSHTTGN